MYLIQDPETSADELALDADTTLTVPSKRRHKSSEQSTSKARRYNSKSGRKRR